MRSFEVTLKLLIDWWGKVDQHDSSHILEETPPTEEAPPVEEAPPADDAPAEEAPVEEEVDDRDPNGTWRILKNPGEAKTSEGVNASITIEVGRGEVLHKSGSRNHHKNSGSGRSFEVVFLNL